MQNMERNSKTQIESTKKKFKAGRDREGEEERKNYNDTVVML